MYNLELEQSGDHRLIQSANLFIEGLETTPPCLFMERAGSMPALLAVLAVANPNQSSKWEV